MQATVNRPFYLMDNVIQNYAWGSVDSIHQLFDIPNPDQQPQAEIWMGSHPSGCSKVETESGVTTLAELIATDPNYFLTEKSAKRFGELPFLFKVLAAATALSVQVHPSKEEAEIGFARENEMDIPLKAAQRNYKDPNHKPELVYALTQYDALNGFRSYDEILENFAAAKITSIALLVEQFKYDKTEHGLKRFFVALLSLQDEEKATAINELTKYAQQHKGERLADLLLTLAEQYPGDIGLFTPLMLHYITLMPGEAMYLDARTPHAYLRGTGLEVMASSDNVLRAGLTPKHMDVKELAKCTSFKAKPESTLLVDSESHGSALHYPIPVDDFKFAIYPNPENTLALVNSAEIIFAIDEPVELIHSSGVHMSISKGQSVFIPAGAQSYSLVSKGRVARVYN